MKDIQFKIKEFHEMLGKYGLEKDYYLHLQMDLDENGQDWIYTIEIHQTEGNCITDTMDVWNNGYLYVVDTEVFNHDGRAECSKAEDIVDWCDEVIESIGNEIDEIIINGGVVA